MTIAKHPKTTTEITRIRSNGKSKFQLRPPADATSPLFPKYSGSVPTLSRSTQGTSGHSEACPKRNHHNRSSGRLTIRKAGANAAMGWLKFALNESCFREVGHTTPTMGWLKLRPNDSCRRDVGHTTPLMDWLKSPSKDNCLRDAGHTTPTMGWSNFFPNDSRRRETGHATPAID